MVKIAVLVKRVPDTATVFSIAADGKSVDLGGVKFVMSPYDEHAVEEAILLRDKKGGEVVVVSAGSSEAMETIRLALAMGADSGMLITGAESLTAKGLSAVLAAALRRIAPDVIFAGKQAVDSDGAQTPERVAELLGIPHASCITRLDLDGDAFCVDREVEGGCYKLTLPSPALFTTQKGINTPRYPTLPNIMKAKRKPVEELSADALGVDAAVLKPGVSVVGMALPRQNRLGKALAGEVSEQAKALYTALREDEKALQ